MTNKIDNKRALVNNRLILLILAIITLLVLLYTIVIPFIDQGKYTSSMMECRSFFSKLEGQPQFFGNDKNTFTNVLINTIEKKCPSKTVKVNNDKITNAGKLISDCWKKTGAGTNIFGNSMEGKGLCVYCGKIKPENQEVKSFKSKLIEELSKEKYSKLFKSSESININDFTLSTNFPIPRNINQKQTATVFYKAYRPSSPPPEDATISNWLKNEVIGETLDNLAGYFGGKTSVINHYASKIQSNNIDTFTGIIITKQEKFEENDRFSSEKNTIEKPALSHNCKYIVPEKNLE